MTDDLLKGLNEFKHYHYGEGNDDFMKALITAGQNPKYFIISCIDSRCNPYTIFRAPPGLFFTHKAMGAIVRPYKKGTALAAALQFALKYNNVETVIVLGHTNCGAIKALAEELDDPEISSFISVAQSALEKAKATHNIKEEILAKTEQQTVLESTQNLKAYPSVAKALSAGKISVKSWIFDMHTGNLLEHSDKTNDFTIINPDTPTIDSRAESLDTNKKLRNH
jgi:carbonic anhydrase